MSDDEDERWARAHQRKLITVRTNPAEHEVTAAEHRIHRFLVWLNDPADPAAPVDISDYELAVLACVESPAAVRVALAALVAGGHLSVEPAGSAPLVGQQFMCRCPVCGAALTAVHRRALERYYADHMAEEHDQHGVGFTPGSSRSKIRH